MKRHKPCPCCDENLWTQYLRKKHRLTKGELCDMIEEAQLDMWLERAEGLDNEGPRED